MESRISQTKVYEVIAERLGEREIVVREPFSRCAEVIALPPSLVRNSEPLRTTHLLDLGALSFCNQG